MKTKLIATLIAVVLVFASIFTLVACNQTLPSVDPAVVAAAEQMTSEELLAKAKEETGDFIAYGNTSRITTAMSNFIKLYGEKLGLSTSNAAAAKKDDSEIYSLLREESKAKTSAKNASMVLIQDSASLELQRGAKDPIVTNYVSKEFKNLVDENNRLPLAHQFINKLFMYNTAGETTAKFSNVWELTDAKYQGKIFFKNPRDEQVNMNFLIMLTSPDWSAKLEAAYKKLHDNAEATDVGAGKTYTNYGYKWIAEFIKNCNFSVGSDTSIASTLSRESNAGKMGLFVLSKLRDASVYGDNLQVSAWDKIDSDGANDPANFQKIDPFAGFMYSIYAQLASKGPRPYTAMLFINYLMTEEGFAPWASVGGYSSNTDVPITSGKETTSPVELKVGDTYYDEAKNEAKESTDPVQKFVYVDNNKKEMVYINSESKTIDGKKVTIKTYKYIADGTTITDIDETTGKATKITLIKDDSKADFKASIKTVKGNEVVDQPLSFWTANLVVEDGAYINTAKATAMDWIMAQIKSNSTNKDK